MALEAKDPQKDIPRAVIGTVLISTLCYCIASVSLIGTVPYSNIDAESCFSVAFETRGVQWASVTTAVGELLVLPLVVFVSFLAQPRFIYIYHSYNFTAMFCFL
jgi:APA family basic amino acid/polyamine antiporter